MKMNISLETVRFFQKKGLVYHTPHSIEMAEERGIDEWDILDVVQKEQPVCTDQFLGKLKNQPNIVVYIWYKGRPAYVAYYKDKDYEEISVKTIAWLVPFTPQWDRYWPKFQSSKKVLRQSLHSIL